MAAEFRCEHCGKLVSLGEQPGRVVKCSHCGKKLVVPAALASLPRPQVAPDSPAGQQQAEEEEQEAVGPPSAAMVAMSRVMPWVISAFFHVGIALITVFLAVIVTDKGGGDLLVKRPEGKVAPKGEKVARRENEQVGGKNLARVMARQPRPTLSREFSIDESNSQAPTARRGEAAVIIGRPGGESGGTGGPLAAFGPENPGGVQFIGTQARADDVVYVIDRSGSMTEGGAFDQLRLKLAESIGGLDPSQRFHVNFFGEKKVPIELESRKLVPAVDENRREVGKFLEDTIPQGNTLVLPALERAFAVLGAPTPGGESRRKLICLLSDGGFEGSVDGQNEYKGLTGNAAVVAWLNDNNPKVSYKDDNGNIKTRRKVQINTYLYRGDVPNDLAVMKQIAAEHDGYFTHIGKNE